MSHLAMKKYAMKRRSSRGVNEERSCAIEAPQATNLTREVNPRIDKAHPIWKRFRTRHY